MATYLEIKDPDAVVKLQIVWTDWLADGDTISTSTWSVKANESPVSSIVDSSSIDADTTVSPNVASRWTSAVVSGGTEGIVYTLTNQVTDSNGYVDDRSYSIRCVER